MMADALPGISLPCSAYNLTMPDPTHLWNSLLWPLSRLVLGLAAGLLIANVLEALRWTHVLSRFCGPFARAAHMGQTASAAFALAFVSSASANGLLSKKYQNGDMTLRELMLANVFNSLPAYLLHMPTIFLLTWPVLGWPAVTYVGLILCAAVLRTLGAFAMGRLILPRPDAADAGGPATSLAARTPLKGSNESPWTKAWKRFRRRVPRLVCFTVPVYLAMYALQQWGAFAAMEQWLAARTEWLAFLKPQAVGIIVLHMAVELGAALGAAGSVLATGALEARDVVLALLVGNILSTPIIAIRHQLPSYAGFYAPRLGLALVLVNQGVRTSILAFVALCYYFMTAV